jgi:hypothetical protein
MTICPLIHTHVPLQLRRNRKRKTSGTLGNAKTGKQLLGVPLLSEVNSPPIPHNLHAQVMCKHTSPCDLEESGNAINDAVNTTCRLPSNYHVIYIHVNVHLHVLVHKQAWIRNRHLKPKIIHQHPLQLKIPLPGCWLEATQSLLQHAHLGADPVRANTSL